MKKPELLCPAGSFKALKAAINSGADAVYLSGKRFGARAYAENFTNDEIKEAIKYAHIYNVKVYVTANTLIYENEIEDFVNFIKFIYLNGVDAVLMQDIGMITLIRKIIPDLEIHASTQTNNCSDQTLEFFKKLGVKRVVLARELSLNQIKKLKTDIEKEVFIHGALCICYSGCCLFSALNGGRSGNRGRCAGPCRLPYTLIKNNEALKIKDKYLLSTKELNTSTNIQQLIKEGKIDSLKIEGRLKSPEYVALVTKMYRNLIDGKPMPSNITKQIKTIFNREFTVGHLFEDKEIINPKSPNHIGIPIGKVLQVNKQIKIKLTDDLNQNDGIRFQNSNKGMIVNKLYNSKKLLINSAHKNDIIYVDNKIKLKNIDNVLKTTDYNLEQDISNYKDKKIPVSANVIANLNKPLIIEFQDKNFKVQVQGSKIERAKKAPLTKEIITQKLSKLGNTPFKITEIKIDLDKNIFIPLNELNELKRQLIKQLIEEKTKINRTISNKNYILPKGNKQNKIIITASVRNEQQMKTLLNKIKYIYTDNYKLYQKYKNKQVFYKPNNVSYNFKNLNNDNLLIGDLGSLNKYKENNCFADYYLNITNSYTISFLKSQNIKNMTLSPELNIDQIANMQSYLNETEFIIYGALRLMVINYNLIDKYSPNSTLNDNFYLLNTQNKKFPIYIQDNNTYIMHHQKINYLNQINDLKKLGITTFRLEFSNESPEEINNLINKIKKVIN